MTSPASFAVPEPPENLWFVCPANRTPHRECYQRDRQKRVPCERCGAAINEWPTGSDGQDLVCAPCNREAKGQDRHPKRSRAAVPEPEEAREGCWPTPPCADPNCYRAASVGHFHPPVPPVDDAIAATIDDVSPPAAPVVAEAEPPSWLVEVETLFATSLGLDDEDLNAVIDLLIEALPIIEAGLREQIAGEIEALPIPALWHERSAAYWSALRAAAGLVRGRSGA